MTTKGKGPWPQTGQSPGRKRGTGEELLLEGLVPDAARNQAANTLQCQALNQPRQLCWPPHQYTWLLRQGPRRQHGSGQGARELPGRTAQEDTDAGLIPVREQIRTGEASSGFVICLRALGL